MWIPVEISLSSYLPFELEIGMLFINRISVGVIEPYIELFELEEVPEDMDDFISKHGAPIVLVITDSNIIIATDNEIAWWDEGEHVDELREITLYDINYILREFDGYVNVEFDDEENHVILMENKVILSLIRNEDWDEILNNDL